MRFRFSEISDDPKLRRIQQEIQDNFVSTDKNGNVDLGSGDIRAKDAWLSGDSLYLGKVKFSAPKPGDNELVLKYDRASHKMIYTDDISSVDAAPTDLTVHMVDTSTHGVNEIADRQTSENYSIAMSIALGMP